MRIVGYHKDGVGGGGAGKADDKAQQTEVVKLFYTEPRNQN